MRVASLGSGSRGNSVLIEAGGTTILIDAGFSGAELERRLDVLGVAPASVDALVLTHEHRDHTIGAGVAARRWKWPVFITRTTAAACETLFRGADTLQFFTGETPFTIGRVSLHPFATCHDAADPVAITARDTTTGLKVGVATDLGRATAPVRSALAGCHFVVLESNHDELLLRESPYPWSVKQRIGGSRGHLSNRLAAELAVHLLHPDLGGVLLAHLSHECNVPEAARATTFEWLRRRGFKGVVDVARQDEPTPVYDVAALVEQVRNGGGQLQLFG